MGAAFEAPWANRISGVASPEGMTATMTWRGRILNLPAALREHGGGAMATGGLLLKRGADEGGTNVMPDGGEGQATFNAGDFDGHWISQTEITTSVQLSSRAMGVKGVARNNGGRPGTSGNCR